VVKPPKKTERRTVTRATTIELLAAGPGGVPVRVWFPHGERHLEFVGGPIARSVPVTLRFTTRIRRRLPYVVRVLRRRLKVHGYRLTFQRAKA
jgi:hypothetical protein